MNRIEKLFAEKDKNLLSVYFTAGFPHTDSTVPVIDALAAAGIDMIEVGVPFSDPMADGPVIQHSSTVALKNGMTLKLLLQQVAQARKNNPGIPMVLMGYLNPMMQYGIEKLFADAKAAGIDAMIVPDLPFGDYLRDFRDLCRRHDMPMIMLITPETSAERIHLIDDNCDGFIYMVSAASTTGTRDRFDAVQLQYFARINAMPLKHPRMIGFGISNPQTMAQAGQNASGVIVGSLFIKCLDKANSPEEAVKLLKYTLMPANS